MSVSPPMSRSIDVARVLCIFFVMFVHTWPGVNEMDTARGVRTVDYIFHFFTDVLGRSSVPLLTMISGWLIAQTYSGDWPALLKSRAKSLLVPLIAWNILMVGVLLFAEFIAHNARARDWSPLGIANALLALTAPPANVQLAFLRDLFVCVAISPLLLIVLRCHRVIVITFGLLLIAYSQYGLPMPLLLRPMILVFFFLGLALNVLQVDVLGGRLWRYLAIAAAAGAVAIFALTIAPALAHGDLHPDNDLSSLVLRVLVACLFWRASVSLAKWSAGEWLARLTPYIFFVFCSHLIILKIFSPAGRRIFGGYYSDGNVWYFFLQPPMALIAGVVIAVALARHAPKLLRVLNAGRLVPARFSRMDHRTG